MGREIKFRGLRKEHSDDGYQDEWRCGNLLNKSTIGEVGVGLEHYSYSEVLPETVGQYTGLKDKNGKEIYEGDIVKSDHIHGKHCIVKFNQLLCRYMIMATKAMDSMGLTTNNCKEIEIIGNVHDNPELLNNGKEV